MPRRASSKRAPTVDPRLEQRVLAACDAVGGFIAYWGFKAIHGRIWTLLMLRKQPMTQVEIADTLGVSRAGVSGTMAELVRYGLVSPVSAARNAPYTAVVNVWPVVADVLRSREWMIVEAARVALEAALEATQTAAAEGRAGPYDATRVRVLLAMTGAAQSLLRMLIKLRDTPSLDAMGGWIGKAATLLGQIGR